MHSRRNDRLALMPGSMADHCEFSHRPSVPDFRRQRIHRSRGKVTACNAVADATLASSLILGQGKCSFTDRLAAWESVASH
jgi:hypothetical protein